MAETNYFPWYDSYYERLAKLSDQEVGRLVRALMIYHRTKEPQELAGRESVAYDFIAVDIDMADEAYREKCEKNKKNRQRWSTVVNGGQRSSTVEKEGAGAAPPLSPPCPSPSSSPPHPPISTPSPNPPIIPPSPETTTAPMRAPAIPTDPKIAVIFTAYAEKIGPKSPLTERIRDQLLVFLDAMGPDCCIRAMDEAVEQGHISWKYVKAILEKKRKQGVRSIADWEKAEQAWEGGKGRTKSNSPTDFQPDAARIQKNNDWLDEFLKEQEGGG